MKAVFIDDYGPVEHLRLGEAPVPEPAANEVLVKIAYAGLRWGDVMARNGLPSRARPTPFIGGQEASGTIAAVGAEVKGWKEGDRVMAMPNGGAFAEYVAMHPARLIRVQPAKPAVEVRVPDVVGGVDRDAEGARVRARQNELGDAPGVQAPEPVAA